LLNFRIFKILYASLPYGNLIGNRSYFPTMMAFLNGEFRKRKIDQVRLTESPFLEPFHPETFKPVSAKVSVLDLGRFDQRKIGESYRSEVRRAIRKAQRSGLRIKRATSKEEMKIFYRLYLSSMERNRAAAKYPLLWFYALYDALIQQGKAGILFAVQGDQYAAGVVLIYSSSSIHYLHNGSEKAYLENRPNDLIIDDTIQKGVKEGKKILDFMGSDPNDLSLLRFKEKWGSQTLDIYTYVKNYHPIRCKIWEWGKRLGSSQIGNRLIKLIRK
jgi:lipid II:glycine glycyltransferase (peptidoglycan interpeptide bridge formation enzyme)